MSKVLVIFEEEARIRYKPIIEMIVQYFHDLSCDVEVFCAHDDMTVEECRDKLTESKCDYICSLDLACFWLSTLLESPLYNILRAKQIHIVIDTGRLLNFKQHDFALNLFVFVPDTGEPYAQEYPNIPNLALYPIFELGDAQKMERNRKTIQDILDAVRRECETA